MLATSESKRGKNGDCERTVPLKVRFGDVSSHINDPVCNIALSFKDVPLTTSVAAYSARPAAFWTMHV